jgi:hypothetical protein
MEGIESTLGSSDDHEWLTADRDGRVVASVGQIVGHASEGPAPLKEQFLFPLEPLLGQVGLGRE